jgi:hypothetical protein
VSRGSLDFLRAAMAACKEVRVFGPGPVSA